MSQPSTTSTGKLRLTQVSRRIGAQLLLDQLSLEVEPGEILALLGPSGCGKSTTLRLIAGLDPLSGGAVWLGERNLTPLPPGERRVGMVFQSYALYPHLSVERNLSLGLELRGQNQASIQGELQRVLSLLELEGLRQRRPAELSGGQRQRVALARALLRQPDLFLLDEPMSNLDARLREDLRPELRQLLRSAGVPVIVVTHDQQEAMGLADRIAVLQEGRLQQLDTAEQLYSRPANRFVARFIGTPSINLFSRDGQEIGLRPEHLELARPDAPQAEGWRGLDGQISHQEWLGDRVVVHLTSPGGMTLRVLRPRPAPEGPWQVRWSSDAELHFDPRTGVRIH